MDKFRKGCKRTIEKERFLLFFVMVCGILFFSYELLAEEPKKDIQMSPSGIVVIIADFGTINSVANTEKWIEKLSKQPIAVKSTDSSASVNSGSVKDPNIGTEQVTWDLKEKKVVLTREVNAVAEENERVRRVCHALRESTLSEKNLRNTIVAKELLQAAIFKRPQLNKFFTIIDRSSLDHAMVEKALSGEDLSVNRAAGCILTATVGDPEESTVVIPLDMTGTKQYVTTYHQPYSGKIRDLNGVVLFAFSGTAEIKQFSNNVVQTVNGNNNRQIMEKVCDMIADDIAKYFTTTLKFKCVSKTEDFDEGDVAIYVDGKEITDDTVVVLAFPHKLRGEAEGFVPVEKVIQCDGPVVTVKLNFKKKK